METKFTKGEWKYTIKNFPDLPITLCLNYAITNPVDYREIKEKMIAQIDFQKNNNPILEEIEANAQLISAAPDLLEQLIASRRLLIEAGYKKWSYRILEIEKAIKKAVGDISF